ncbi:MAG: hypothetical protein IJI32_08400 [Clostridia bacterium]|nr:hypothetical protein [Clostridia bacterium]
MRKRIISIVLAVAMILCLIPIGVLAADGDSTVNPATGREQGPEGDVPVAVMVYGDNITKLSTTPGLGFSDFINAVEAEIEAVAGNLNVPEVEMYLVNKDDQEYKLTQENASKTAFIASFKYRSEGDGGITGWFVDLVQSAYEWLFDDFDQVESLYRIYGAKNVPEGEYTLEIRSIADDGFKLIKPETRELKVTVEKSATKTCYVGFESMVGMLDLTIPIIDTTIYKAIMTMPGVFLQSSEPGIEFTSANLGDQPVPGSEFVMVNRDETEKLIKAFYGLGKDTFESAMSLIGTEGFTWEELSILRNEVLKWDSENAQISIEGKNAYKLLGTYWSLMQASAKEPLLNFLKDDTELRIPAILAATADENGVVHFGPDNNVTLIWSLEILQKMGGVAFSKIEEYGLIDELFPDPMTGAIIKFVIKLGKSYLGSDNMLWDADGNLKKDFVNGTMYLLLQNDNIMEFAQDKLNWIVGDNLTEEEKEFLKLLPDHALLTKKMPAGKYILLETSVPDGYFRSPFFYTVDLEWHPEAKYARDWYYASVADLGLIAPYFAEDFYEWLRNYDFKVEADKVLNYITDDKTGDLIANTLTGKNDITEYTITYFSNILYNYMGGSLLYNSELDLAKDMTKHLYAYGKSAQNLLQFGDQVATRSKSVVAGQLTKDWIFYNYSTSLRTNSALKTQKILNGVAKAIDTTEDHPVTSAVKSTIQKIADKIDTTNRIKDQVTNIQNKISSFFSDIGSKIGNKVLDGVFSALKTVLGWSKL